MTTDKRPPVVKNTAANNAKREAELDRGLRLTIDGEVYQAQLRDVTPAIARELRNRTGMGFVRLMATVADDPDIDVVSAFVWVARRIKGEYVDLDDVEVAYGDLVDGFEAAEPTNEVDEGDVPEA